MTGESFRLNSERNLSMNSLSNPVLPREKKRELRIQAIKELIRSKPVGVPTTLVEFQEVGHFKGNGYTFEFLKGLIKKGIILKHDSDQLNRHYYSVAEDVHTVKKDRRGKNGGKRLGAGRKKGIGNSAPSKMTQTVKKEVEEQLSSLEIENKLVQSYRLDLKLYKNQEEVANMNVSLPLEKMLELVSTILTEK